MAETPRRGHPPAPASSEDSRDSSVSQGWVIFTVFFSPFVFCFAIAAILALVIR